MEGPREEQRSAGEARPQVPSGGMPAGGTTPNRPKAPWYFLNLQELLLHMHPTLAGVLVPGGALVLLAAIPYIDNTPQGTGRWFTTPVGRQIALFSVLYAAVLNTLMIFFDEFFPTPYGNGVRPIIQYALGLPKVVNEVI